MSLRLLCFGAFLAVAGCSMGVKPGTPEWRALTTRDYSQPPEKVYAAARTVMLDQGAQLVSSDSDGGSLIVRINKTPMGIGPDQEYTIQVMERGQETVLQLNIHLAIETTTGMKKDLVRESWHYEDFFDRMTQQIGP